MLKGKCYTVRAMRRCIYIFKLVLVHMSKREKEREKNRHVPQTEYRIPFYKLSILFFHSHSIFFSATMEYTHTRKILEMVSKIHFFDNNRGGVFFIFKSINFPSSNKCEWNEFAWPNTHNQKTNQKIYQVHAAFSTQFLRAFLCIVCCTGAETNKAII